MYLSFFLWLLYHARADDHYLYEVRSALCRIIGSHGRRPYGGLHRSDYGPVSAHYLRFCRRRLGVGFRYQWSATRLLGTVAAVLAGAFALTCLLAYVALDINIFTQLNDFFTQLMDTMAAQYKSQGMSDVQMTEAWHN